MTRYIRCDEKSIPQGVRFDVPRRNQGQFIEVAYGDFGHSPNDDGDPWKRVRDELGNVRYYRLATDEEVSR